MPAWSPSPDPPPANASVPRLPVTSCCPVGFSHVNMVVQLHGSMAKISQRRPRLKVSLEVIL